MRKSPPNKRFVNITTHRRDWCIELPPLILQRRFYSSKLYRCLKLTLHLHAVWHKRLSFHHYEKNDVLNNSAVVTIVVRTVVIPLHTKICITIPSVGHLRICWNVGYLSHKRQFMDYFTHFELHILYLRAFALLLLILIISAFD